ncbi:MAG: uroporphyrinogen-III synthase [Porphyromonadaceae bacterium]|nr:uroporphyrinogen-III synthase [Porphyromonadaceae bacterium]
MKKILISQPQPESGKSPYYEVAKRYGIEITFRPFIQVESVTTREFRDQKINILEHSAIIFTTRKAMEHFFHLLGELRLSIPEEMKYFCLSEQVANYLQKFITYRKRKVFYPTNSTNEALVALIHKHNKEKYFLPLPEEHRNDLIDLILTKKISLNKGIMFRTVPSTFSEEERAEQYDMMIFFSPVGVASLQENYPHIRQTKVKLAAFGPQTARAIEEAGFRLDLAAPTPEAPSMVTALEQYLGKLMPSKG